MRDNNYFVETQGITRRREISAERIPADKQNSNRKQERIRKQTHGEKRTIVYTRDKRGRQDTKRVSTNKLGFFGES